MTNVPQTAGRNTWRFPRTFWFANIAELFERAAYYGMFITLTLYLSNRVKFSDVSASAVAGSFSSILYLLPMFMGAAADRLGFRRALLVAFALLSCGYVTLGAFQHKLTVVLSLAAIMLGGAMVKPVISGTAAKCSDETNRARAFSIFYMIVNIGSFSGKRMAGHIRTSFDLGLDYINYYAAAMALCALLVVLFFYRNVDRQSSTRSVAEVWAGLTTVVRNFRFMALILIVGGFWSMQNQLYSTLPKYILRIVPQGRPEDLANINPLVVMTLVVPITHLVRRLKPATSIGIALLVATLFPISMSLSPLIQAGLGGTVHFFRWSLDPVTISAILGITCLGLGECFLSPKFYEFASKQAPPGQVAMYMGYQSLAGFVGQSLAFYTSGPLLTRFCPDPETLTAPASAAALPEVYAHAHYLWYAYAAVGFLAFIALLVFKFTTDAIDRRRELAAQLTAAGATT
jgi:dipeptide/tripeptide permease